MKRFALAAMTLFVLVAAAHACPPVQAQFVPQVTYQQTFVPVQRVQVVREVQHQQVQVVREVAPRREVVRTRTVVRH
jgi:hypothetical protein